MRIKLIYLLLIGIVLPFSGCLRNLNVTEFFRKLEIKNPDYYEIVSDNKSEVEEEIIKMIEEESGKEIDEITFWGEGRYACGKVVVTKEDQEFVQVLGKCRLVGDDFYCIYTYWFVPDEKDIVKEVALYYPYYRFE